MGDSSRFPVLVDAEAFAEDLYHATSAGRTVAERERARLQRDGIAGPGLVYLAFGLRHPTRAWQPSVYEVAYRRLHDAS